MAHWAPNFGSDTLQKTIGKSNYNSLQLSLRHTSGRLELSAGYTYGKSLDESSNLGEEVNPINPALSYALSSFDIRQNFVVSYNYRIPFENLFRVSNRWTQGWEISGYYALLHRPARHPLQQHGQLAARHHSRRHQ